MTRKVAAVATAVVAILVSGAMFTAFAHRSRNASGMIYSNKLTASKILLKRDIWGVPHIFAHSLVDAAYALGYAQAEDRLEQIYANYRTAIGRSAEVKGPEAVEDDWKQILSGHAAVCKRRYPELSAPVREMCEAYQAGVKEFVRVSGQKPANALEIEPWMEPALMRYLIFNWPMGEAQKKLGMHRLPIQFSNEWAVMPQRTADHAALLLIDPHIYFDGPFRFYEFRLHAGNYDISGFGPAGAPFLALGHNANLGWAFTTGGPSTTDIYVEKIDPNNPDCYIYDGKPRKFIDEDVEIKVKGSRSIHRVLRRSHHGPITQQGGSEALAIACPYFDQIAVPEQFYRMMTATNLQQFNAAMAMNQLMQQNMMYADDAGNIEYIRTGRVPIRPEGFDFLRPVDGSTSKSEWQGIHPMKDLIQVLNPKQGYMQNCNCSPDTLARDLGMQLSRYPGYIFNDTPGNANQRARRALKLLDGNSAITIDQAKDIVLDITEDGYENWIHALVDGVATVDRGKIHGVTEQEVRHAIAILQAWNGKMDQASTGATLYRGIRMVAPGHKVDRPHGHAQELLESLAEVIVKLKEGYGSFEVPYGEIHRIQHGAQSYPVSGSADTLRAMASNMEGKVLHAFTGQSCTQLVQFKRGAVRAWSATPYGESDHPDSPHFTDQAAKLYTTRQLKSVYFQTSELEGHIESTLELRR